MEPIMRAQIPRIWHLWVFYDTDCGQEPALEELQKTHAEEEISGWDSNSFLIRSIGLSYSSQVYFSDKSNLLGQVGHYAEAKCYMN